MNCLSTNLDRPHIYKSNILSKMHSIAISRGIVYDKYNIPCFIYRVSPV